MINHGKILGRLSRKGGQDSGAPDETPSVSSGKDEQNSSAPSAAPISGSHGLRIRPAPREVVPILNYSDSANSNAAFIGDFGEAMDSAVKMRAGSLRGHSHSRYGEWRQDAYCIVVDEDAIHIAVCDGAGSQRNSAEGAYFAATQAVAASREGQTPKEIGETVVKGLHRLSEYLGTEVITLSTTLCWARISVVEPSEPWLCEFTEWGNSELVTFSYEPDRTRRAKKQYIPESGDTATLPLNPIPAASGSFNWVPGDVICIVTDGIGDYLSKDSDLTSALRAAWQNPPEFLDFVSHLSFQLAPAHDDRSAVVLWRE